MYLLELRRQLAEVLGDAEAAHRRSRSLRHARWQLAVLAELAEPGEMQLSAVFNAAGQIVDFEWRRLSPAVTRAVGCPGANLVGQSMLQYFDESHPAYELLDIYRAAWKSGASRVARIILDDCVYLHQAARSMLGVAVRVTNITAFERVIAAQHMLRVLEMAQSCTGKAEDL